MRALLLWVGMAGCVALAAAPALAGGPKVGRVTAAEVRSLLARLERAPTQADLGRAGEVAGWAHGRNGRVDPDALAPFVEGLVAWSVARLDHADTALAQRAAGLLDTLARGPLVRAHLEATGKTSLSLDLERVLAAVERPETTRVVSILGYVRPLPPEALSRLARLLPGDGAREAEVSGVLAGHGEAARAPLLAVLIAPEAPADRSPDTAAGALGGVVLAPAERRALLAHARSDAPGVRRARALRALYASLRTAPDAVEPLLASLADPAEEVRRVAVHGFDYGHGALDATRPRLEALLATPQRTTALGALLELGVARSSVASLRGVLDDPSAATEDRVQALLGLEQLRGEAKAALPSVWERWRTSTDEGERLSAARALEAIAGVDPRRQRHGPPRY